MNSTLVLGIGNTLLCDEGCGVYVIHHLQRHYGQCWPEVRFLDGGTLSFTLAVFLENAQQLIVVDAAELNAKPGAINIFIGGHMDTFLARSQRTAHDIGLLDLLAIAHLTDRLPIQRALIGIQPQQIAWGDQPSRAVAKAIPNAAKRVLELIHVWERGGDLDSQTSTLVSRRAHDECV
jgi:hydrogenase maturation protease